MLRERLVIQYFIHTWEEQIFWEVWNRGFHSPHPIQYNDPSESRLMLLPARCNMEIAFGMNSVGQTQASALMFFLGGMALVIQ